jgi:hypothetical protein
MKNILKFTLVATFVLLQLSCKTNTISPKEGTITIPAKGEIRVWENTEHGSFSLHLENNNATKSCEAYTVKNNHEKWISPSLLAKSTLDFTVPSDGHVLLKNFNDESLTIKYSIR